MNPSCSPSVDVASCRAGAVPQGWLSPRGGCPTQPEGLCEHFAAAALLLSFGVQGLAPFTSLLGFACLSACTRFVSG